MATEKEVKPTYTIIHQPYRITMAKWPYSPIEKRILTQIISGVQPEILQLRGGLHVEQLDLFLNSAHSDSVPMVLDWDGLVKSNNYNQVKRALANLRRSDVEIVLPAVGGNGKTIKDATVIITGLIERVVIEKYSRKITVYIHRATAMEFIKIQNGLTSFAKEVMFRTDNRHVQRIYEYLSHWKDKPSITLTPDQFRDIMGLKQKYGRDRDLVNLVIKPAEKELMEMTDMDIYFEFEPVMYGIKYKKFTFKIVHRKRLAEIHDKELQDVAYNKQLLREHFAYNKDAFSEVEDILSNPAYSERVRQKITVLYLRKTDVKQKPIKDIIKYTIEAFKEEFRDELVS